LPFDADHPWHALPEEDVLDRLDAGRDGLDQAEAARRLEAHGPNSLPKAADVPPLRRFLGQFHSALIYFLLAAAAAALALGHGVDAAVILAVVLVNAVVGFLQEGKAERALSAIRDLIAPRAAVLRDGARQVVAVERLVPGDVVLLEAGDRTPADLRLLRARGMSMDEALLTGESVTAQKRETVVAAEAPLGDRANMAYSGTLAATGQGVGVVVATGPRTEIGRISRLLQEVETATTPLLRQIDRFARSFTLIVLACAAALFAFATLARGFDWSEALLAVVALSVGVIPEGLPAVITITLAIGVQRMAARKAVIRKLPAVETLGATSVICTDKTGTLTRNEMTVRHIWLEGRRIEVEGAGYAPEGGLVAPGAEDAAAALAAAAPILRCGLLCNGATLRRADGGWRVEGDPMEGALIAAAMKAGLDPAPARAEWPRLDEIPFDAAHRFMATLHRGPSGEIAVFVKGAPEAVLAMTGADPGPWEARIAEAAAEGERVLGFGMKRLDAVPETLTAADLAQGVAFLGIMGFIDPPRAEAAAAVAECRAAGISVKMITGDHRATALAIAGQIALADRPEAVTGAEIDALDDAALAALAPRVAVFARASPEHKLRIVRALPAGGAIVAMTGDGVNDAPSLKQADVGTAMGDKGTEAAKEAADMVLLDDDFASIVAAVHEGRTVHDNIRKVVAWTIPTNGGEALAVVLAILVGFAMPMTATQILWVNLASSATLGLALAFEPAEPGVMRRPPRRPDAGLLSPFLLWRVILVSGLMAALTLGGFFLTLAQGHDLAMARTVAVNLLMAAEVFYLFNVRYLHRRSATWRGARGTRAVLAAVGAVVLAQAAFTYWPPMQAVFDTRALGLGQLVLIVAAGAGLALLLEAEKALMRRMGWFAELGA
jgi:magnesium-transporting ATPase (P-type)